MPDFFYNQQQFLSHIKTTVVPVLEQFEKKEYFIYP